MTRDDNIYRYYQRYVYKYSLSYRTCTWVMRFAAGRYYPRVVTYGRDTKPVYSACASHRRQTSTRSALPSSQLAGAVSSTHCSHRRSESCPPCPRIRARLATPRKSGSSRRSRASLPALRASLPWAAAATAGESRHRRRRHRCLAKTLSHGILCRIRCRSTRNTRRCGHVRCCSRCYLLRCLSLQRRRRRGKQGRRRHQLSRPSCDRRRGGAAPVINNIIHALN
jgi:hypothetical protein